MIMEFTVGVYSGVSRAEFSLRCTGKECRSFFFLDAGVASKGQLESIEQKIIREAAAEPIDFTLALKALLCSSRRGKFIAFVTVDGFFFVSRKRDIQFPSYKLFTNKYYS